MKTTLVLLSALIVACGRGENTALNHVSIYDESGDMFVVAYLGDDRFEVYRCRTSSGEYLPNLNPIEEIDRDCPEAGRTVVGSSTITEAREQAYYLLDQYVKHLVDKKGHNSASAAEIILEHGGIGTLEKRERQVQVWSDELDRLKAFAEKIGGDLQSKRISELQEKLKAANTEIEKTKPLTDEFKIHIDNLMTKIKDRKIHPIISSKNQGEITYEFLYLLASGNYRSIEFGEQTFWFRWVPENQFYAPLDRLDGYRMHQVAGFWLQVDEVSYAQARALRLFSDYPTDIIQYIRRDTVLSPYPYELITESNKRQDYIYTLGYELTKLVKQSSPFRLPTKSEMMSAYRCGLPSTKPLPEIMFSSGDEAPWVHSSQRSGGVVGASSDMEANPCGFKSLMSNVREIVREDIWGLSVYLVTKGDFSTPYEGEGFIERSEGVSHVGFRLALKEGILPPPSIKYRNNIPASLRELAERNRLSPKERPKRQLYSISAINPPLPEERILGFRRDKEYEGDGVKVLFVYHESPFSDMTDIQSGMIILRIHGKRQYFDREDYGNSTQIQLRHAIDDARQGHPILIQVYDPYRMQILEYNLDIKSYMETNKSRIARQKEEDQKIAERRAQYLQAQRPVQSYPASSTAFENSSPASSFPSRFGARMATNRPEKGRSSNGFFTTDPSYSERDSGWMDASEYFKKYEKDREIDLRDRQKQQESMYRQIQEQNRWRQKQAAEMLKQFEHERRDRIKFYEKLYKNR